MSANLPQIISTSTAPAAIGPYSQAVAYGGLLFCSGQIPLEPQSMTITGTTAAEQAKQCLENLGAVLQAAGTSFDRALKTTIFLTDLADFQAVNEVYASYFPNLKPARSTIQVAALPRDAKVEIELVAAL